MNNTSNDIKKDIKNHPAQPQTFKMIPLPIIKVIPSHISSDSHNNSKTKDATSSTTIKEEESSKKDLKGLTTKTNTKGLSTIAETKADSNQGFISKADTKGSFSIKNEGQTKNSVPKETSHTIEALVVKI